MRHLSLNLLTPSELVSVAPNVQPNTQYAELIELAHERLRNRNKGAVITFSEICAEIGELGKTLDIRAPTDPHRKMAVADIVRRIEAIAKRRKLVSDQASLKLRGDLVRAVALVEKLQHLELAFQLRSFPHVIRSHHGHESAPCNAFGLVHRRGRMNVLNPSAMPMLDHARALDFVK